MTKNKFLICFYPGSSGRFLASLFHRFLFQIDSNIILCHNNSAHYDWGGLSINYINDKIVYQMPDDIIATHDFPNYSLESLTDDMKKRIVILIRLCKDDVKEIYFNCELKNHRIKLQNKALDLIIKQGKFKDLYIDDFISKKSNFNNVVEINYKSIFEKENHNYKLLNTIKNITGQNIPQSCYTSLETYIKNRNELVQKYNLR